MLWTEENIAKLRAAWESGGSAAIIETFGVTQKRADELRRIYLRIRKGPNRRGKTYRWTAEFANQIQGWIAEGGINKVIQETGWSRDYAMEATRRTNTRTVFNRQTFKSNDIIDQTIKKAYAEKRRGAIREMAHKNGLDYSWVKYRARSLGIQTQKKSPEWTLSEKLILESLVGSTTQKIQEELKRLGYYRTLEAIDCRMVILGLTRIHEEGLNGSDVAKIFGVEQRTVSRWIIKGIMKGEKKSYTCYNPTGEPSQWFVTPREVKNFIKTHRGRYDLKKVNQDLFLAILFDSWKQEVILTNSDEEYTDAASGSE